MPSSGVRPPSFTLGTLAHPNREPLQLEIPQLPDFVFDAPKTKPSRRHRHRSVLVPDARPQPSALKVPQPRAYSIAPTAPRNTRSEKPVPLELHSKFGDNEVRLEAVPKTSGATLAARMRGTVLDIGSTSAHVSGDYELATQVNGTTDAAGVTSESLASKARASVKVASKLAADLEVYVTCPVSSDHSLVEKRPAV